VLLVRLEDGEGTASFTGTARFGSIRAVVTELAGKTPGSFATLAFDIAFSLAASTDTFAHMQ
jgi:hypothetical protein